MSTTPDVAITRTQTRNVTFEGGDGLALALAERAGFIKSSPYSFWYRLPWDEGEERENQMATRAARMLTAAGYRVALDPGLDADQVTAPGDPAGQRVYGQQILALTDQFNGAESYEAAAALTEQVLDPVDGVLARLSEFFEAAVEKAKESGTDEGWDLSERFEDAASALTSLGEDLHVAADQLRDLGPAAAVPEWRDQVTSYYTTAPHRQPTEAIGTAAAPASLPQSAAPARGRAR